jgi:hypothetical protein
VVEPGEQLRFAGSPGSSSTSLASPMSRNRFFGARSRQRRSSLRIAGGVSGGNADRSISFFRTPPSVSDTESPRNIRWPVSIS